MLNWPQGRRSWWPFLHERRKGSKTRKIVGGDPCRSSWVPRTVPPLGRWVWGYRMIRWRKSTREESIYRTRRAGAILTYLFTVSVKSEGVQVDMVTVRTVIKGLCSWFDSKRSWFLEIFYCARSPGRLISSFYLTGMLPMNVFWGDPVREGKKFEVRAGRPG